MKYNFLRVEPEYTGGNIYCFIGELADGTFFVADDCGYDVRLLNGNVFEADWNEEVFDYDWQEAHLVADLSPTKSLEFFIDLLTWVINNKPEGNYNIPDMKASLETARDILDNPREWR